MPNALSIVGETYGRLTICHEFERRGSDRQYLCRCSCGNEVVVTQFCLRAGKTRSCGCIRRENPNALKHGYKGTPEYIAWKNMRARCNNPNRPQAEDYGGRGITYAPEWDDFEVFLAHVGPRPSSKHSIDRIDNNGNYEPGNVRWATSKEQNQNRRDNHYLTHNDETLVVSEWSRRTGIDHRRITRRITQLGWSVEKALTTPVRQR